MGASLTRRRQGLGKFSHSTAAEEQLLVLLAVLHAKRLALDSAGSVGEVAAHRRVGKAGQAGVGVSDASDMLSIANWAHHML